MPKERELAVAEFRKGSTAQADTWITLSRQDYPNVSANLGINLNGIDDSVVVRLSNGDMVEIFGNGELWFRGSNMIRLATDPIPWR